MPGTTVDRLSWRAVVVVVLGLEAVAVALWLIPASIHVVDCPEAGPSRVALFAPQVRLIGLGVAALALASFITVRSTLRDLHRPDRFKASPLMGSALAVGFEGADPARLGAYLLAGIEQIGREPRSETLRAVLDRTFVRAAPTQEAAAEVLELPFSTYRRYLAKALERLTDLLWAVEIGEVRLDID